MPSKKKVEIEVIENPKKETLTKPKKTKPILKQPPPQPEPIIESGAAPHANSPQTSADP
jgi:hypothetical protein